MASDAEPLDRDQPRGRRRWQPVDLDARDVGRIVLDRARDDVHRGDGGVARLHAPEPHDVVGYLDELEARRARHLVAQPE